MCSWKGSDLEMLRRAIVAVNNNNNTERILLKLLMTQLIHLCFIRDI